MFHYVVLSIICLFGWLVTASDHYSILGVSRTASIKQIKQAYHKRALKWHPDKNQNNQEAAHKQFKQLVAAYEILSDEEKRKSYDVSLPDNVDNLSQDTPERTYTTNSDDVGNKDQDTKQRVYSMPMDDILIKPYVVSGVNKVFKRSKYGYMFDNQTVDQGFIEDDPYVLYPTKREVVQARYRNESGYYVNGQMHVLEFSNFLKLLIDNKNEQALMPYVDKFCGPSATDIYYWMKVRVKNLYESCYSNANCDVEKMRKFRSHPYIQMLYAKKNR